MYAQELASHYSEIRRRLNPVPRPVKFAPVLKMEPVAPVVAPAGPSKPEPRAYLLSRRDIERHQKSIVRLAPEPQGGETLLLEPPAPLPKRMTAGRINREVSREFQIPIVEMMSKERSASVVWPRQVAMYLNKSMLHRSLLQIARGFNRDHTTVLHAIRKVRRLMKADPAIAHTIAAIRLRLTEDVG